MRHWRAVLSILLVLLASCAAARQSAAAVASEYRMSLDVSDDLSRIDGVLDLHWSNQGTAALDAVQFFLFPNLTPGAMVVESCSVEGVPVTPVLSMHDSKAKVSLPHPLAPGAAVNVSLRYHVLPPLDPDGEYGGFTRTDSVLAMAWCYPVVLSPAAWSYGYPAPHADYMVKEPSAYTVTLTYPGRCTLASPCAETDRRVRGGRVTSTLRLAPARDFFAALGSAWTVSTAEAGRTRVQSFAPAGREAAAALTANEAATALEYFSKRFGPYPYDTFTIAAVPLSSYGLEFPGIIAITDRIYDLDSNVNGVPSRAFLESTVAHETAHQWFYGIVGNDQVAEPWVDEAFAQYAAWLYFRDRRGAARADGFHASFLERWDRVGRKEIPVGLAVDDYTAREYGAIVYGRGPLFLETLSDRVGEKTFDAILREWVRRYTNAMATGKDFQRLASELSGQDLSALFNQWVWPSHN